MKKQSDKKKKVSKGMPSAVLLSILIHAGLFLLAGMLVVFTVVKKEEPKFEPPKAVERPKMKLRKPKVKPQKSSKPKSTTRIVTRNNRTSMPDIELPEMSGMGDGLGDGFGGGFDMMPDLGELTLFGGDQSIGNDFSGYFYDMKRDRRGRNIPFSKETFLSTIAKFMGNDWKISTWSKYYRSSKELYATHFMIPPIPANKAPEAFGETDCVACCWVAHYKGQLVSPEDIKIRFWAHGDEILAVRVNGEINLIAPWPGESSRFSYKAYFTHLWGTSAAESRRYVLGNCYAEVGDWITLKAGEPVDMEVLFGEVNGGIFCAMICVEVEGETYPTNPYKLGPKLPMFKTEEPSLTMAENIWARLDPGDATVTNGPVFRDYKIEPPSTANPEPELKVPESVEEDSVRLWTIEDGNTIEAEFVTYIAGNVVLKTSRGKRLKIPFSRFSEADQRHIDLANPPEFKIDFLRKSSQVPIPDNGPWANVPIMHLYDYTFGVRIKQSSSGNYSHPVTVEYFAIGDEVDGDNYILLDRGSDTFIPSDIKKGSLKGSYEFRGTPVRVERYPSRASAPMRGAKYGGFMITLTDVRGKIIQQEASSDFLLDIREKLKNLPVTRHFDRDGQRVSPPRPTIQDRPDWMRNE